MEKTAIFDKTKIADELDQFINYARVLEEQNDLAKAIQAWDTVLSVASTPTDLAQANFHLGQIYREWDEYFTAQRFLGKAHQLHPADPRMESELNALNGYIADNQAEIFDERERKNSDQIVSLFRIATGLKLLQMDKATQAYPLMKSRTKLYPNAAVAKHLLTDIMITADEKNAAIEFLEAGGWLIHTRHEMYSITESGLYEFYGALAELHMANEAYGDAAACYEQAYWLDDSSTDVLYHKVICDAKTQTWEAGLALLDYLSDELPHAVDSLEYNSAVATIYGLAYQATRDSALGQRAVEACETVLAADKKNKEISNLLKSLRSDTFLKTDRPAGRSKKKWWPW